MFSKFKIRIIIGVYIFILISIPVGAYLASQNTNIKSKAATDTKTVTDSPTPKSSPNSDVRSEETSQDGTNTTLPTSFGPTLNLKVALEGRPAGNQKDKLFVGIVEGSQVGLNPKFLLSFTIDLPLSGEFSGLSLAGLTSGNSYSALLKGSAQIATASAFVMGPTVTNLNAGQAITLTTGDLNEDNSINSGDYSIIQKVNGSTPQSSNWNENADFNKDGIINIFDIAIITKNFGKIGDSGPWTSPIPKEASKSAGLVYPPNSATGGYWIWLPSF